MKRALDDSVYTWQGKDLLVRIRLQPRASADEIVGIQGGALKVRITSPPVEGKANEHLIRYLADVFGVARSHIRLVSGATGRNKRLLIQSPAKLPPMLRGPTAIR